MLELQSTTLSSLGTAILAMIIVCVLFIADSTIVFWVVFAMISMDIGIAGYLSLWGADLDPTTVVNILVCVTFVRSFSDSPDQISPSTSHYACFSCKQSCLSDRYMLSDFWIIKDPSWNDAITLTLVAFSVISAVTRLLLFLTSSFRTYKSCTLVTDFIFHSRWVSVYASISPLMSVTESTVVSVGIQMTVFEMHWERLVGL